MTPYQLGQLIIRVNRHSAEGEKVYAFLQTLLIPDEHEAAFMESTAALANLADLQTDSPAPDNWLRTAKQVAEMIGLEAAPIKAPGRPNRRR